MWRLPAIVFAALAAAGWSGASPNVHGTLVVPRAVYCPSDDPCDPPAVDYTLVFSRRGRASVRAHVGSTGRFALSLAPGSYSVRAVPALPRGRLTPSSVVVPRAGLGALRVRVSV
jgi:hypothetical protein